MIDLADLSGVTDLADLISADEGVSNLAIRSETFRLFLPSLALLF